MVKNDLIQPALFLVVDSSVCLFLASQSNITACVDFLI